MSGYPTNTTELIELADELTRLGFAPTQSRHHFDRVLIEAMMTAMRNGSFDWAAASLQPVILGPNGEILGGHHRVVAAAIAGIDLRAISGLRPQVQRVSLNYRPVYNWMDVLPG